MRKQSYPHIQSLDLGNIAPGSQQRFWFDIVENAFGEPMSIPIMIKRGKEDGPIVGITAAVHGNELNGIPVIHRLFRELENTPIKGTVIGLPVVNAPSFFQKQRRFIDNVDLNHVMPGVEDGNVSQAYSYRFFEEIVKQFDYLLDLHTASTGRINSYYIRADMDDKVTRDLALLQNAQIIVHNPPSDGTVRGAASLHGIRAITLEVGNPSLFQKGMIRTSMTGLYNALIYLNILEDDIEEPDTDPVICDSSFWMYTETGGLLTVPPGLTKVVQKGELIATQTNIFGEKIKDYHAPEAGIVIGKSTSPVNQTGGRILHLGRIRS